MTTRELLEEAICELPLFEYTFFPSKEIIFSTKVRKICEMNDCGRFNRSWSCPPAIGTIEDCIARCKPYKNTFMFSTVTSVEDSYNFDSCIKAKVDHERVLLEAAKIFRQYTDSPLVLGTGCMLCEQCSYPNAPCRHPDNMFPSIESHGILIMQLAAQYNMSYDCGQNIVTYFGVIFYNDKTYDN